MRLMVRSYDLATSFLQQQVDVLRLEFLPNDSSGSGCGRILQGYEDKSESLREMG
jgi:hypothetical protein